MGGQVYARRDVLRLGAGALALAGCRTGLGRGREGVPPLRVVFYTDVHASPDGDTPRALAMAAAAINAAEPDLVIGGGDFVTGGFTASAPTMAPRWDAYMAMRDALVAPHYPVLGNHDLVAAVPDDGSSPAADPRRVFRERFRVAHTAYAFDVAGRHFVVLDSVDVVGGELGYRGWVNDAQLAWLGEDLARVAPTTPIVVATHLPLVTEFFAGELVAPANRVIVNADAVLARFAWHRLVLVLQGHLHVHEEILRGGTVFLTGGAIAGGWWRGPWRGTAEGFAVVTLAADRVDCRYVSYGWRAPALRT